MKAKHLSTLDVLLAEYGMKPGVSTAVGDQQSGQQAKATKEKSKSVLGPSKSPTTAPSKSPTLNPNPGKTVQEPEKPEPQISVAKDIEPGAKAVDADGENLEIVGAVGKNKSTPDTIVAKNIKGEYVTVEPDSELEVTESFDDKLDKMLKRKNKLRRKIKRVLRAQKHAVQGEPVFEINFNSKEIITNALDAPIQCGFEAETTWPNFSSGVEGLNWDYADWDMIENYAYDQGFSREMTQMKNAYNDWLSEDKVHEYEYALTRDLVSERIEDEYYIDRYVTENVYDEDVENYRDEKLDDLSDKRDEFEQDAQREESDPDGEPKVAERYRARAQAVQDEIDEYESWDTEAWAREYVEIELQEEFTEWLEEDIRDNGEVWEDAWEQAREEHSMDDWCNDVYDGLWSSACMDFDIYMEDELQNNLDSVEESLASWATEYSKTDEIRQGSYHSGKSVDNEYWRVEDDSSIEGEGAKAEIISPVYSTPREMLAEMKSLFEHFEEEDVETNSSTGLHVTMSFGGDFKETNPLVLAVLLGDQYVLKQFNRQYNSYAKSQQKNIQFEIERLMKDGGSTEDFDELYGILTRGLDKGKFSSINFKGAKNSDGNDLIEFRIAGGNDYHTNYEKSAKAVIRYAATMNAASEDQSYNRQDFLKSVYRMVNKTGNQALAPTRDDVNITLPETEFVKAAREILSKTGDRLDAVEKLNSAYQQLESNPEDAKQDFIYFMVQLLIKANRMSRDG